MKQLIENRKIYKISSGTLKKNKYSMDIDFIAAKKETPDIIVDIASSQLLRWIDEINNINNADNEINRIKNSIKREKKKQVTSKSKAKIKELYAELNTVQFIADLVSVTMDSCADYDKINKGFVINGIKFKRLLGTTGGIKNRTIFYINAALYPEIMKRIDNGRNLDKEIVPAKLEAYRALVCSASTPIPQPNGIIVINDCITHFKENVIKITDEADGEPVLTHEKDYEIERNNSDGCGFCTPAYAQTVNRFLNGSEDVLSGFNTRYAFNKGMVFPFDFVEFAEKYNHGDYMVVDAWGAKRDVRNADVILTISMVKLWDSYSSWEDYYNNCLANGYQFSAAKIAPSALEDMRTVNYQYLQSYQFTDEELQELCQPTIDEIKDIIGGDYRKSIVYLGGNGITEKNVLNTEDDYLKALMINPDMINDPFVISRIKHNIAKKITNAKIGKLNINGNYSIIGGDLFALAQSMFNLPITGCLKAGEVFNKYWQEKNASEICVFRSPMSNANNIRKVKIADNETANYWFRYCRTVTFINAFDTLPDALNGADYDSDTVYTTNNPILLKATHNLPAIICIQRKAEKKVPTEADLIESNKLGFNDDIGTITNYATSMYDVQSGFKPNSKEYKALDYRIICMQHFQQCAIDKIKGVVAKPLPAKWYKLSKDLTDFEAAICANNKPYFMTYIYPSEMREYKKYIENSNSNSVLNFGLSIDALYHKKKMTEAEKTFINFYEQRLPVGLNGCTVNKIAWLIEKEFMRDRTKTTPKFDYTVLKSGIGKGYSTQLANSVKALYEEYTDRLTDYATLARINRIDKNDSSTARQALKDDFKAAADCICPDSALLADVILDICYRNNNSKQFAWDVCGEQIIKNLLSKANNTISLPVLDDNGDFAVNGKKYKMMKYQLEENEE